MGAAPQFRVQERAAVPEPVDAPDGAPESERDKPLELLRDVITQLKSLDGDARDPAEMASLLAEAQQALERARTVAEAIAQCEASLNGGHFEQAYAALDAALAIYPGDQVLLGRRSEIEPRRKEWEAAAAVKAALEEADWFLQQERPDLAFQILKQKTADLGNPPELVSRQAEVQEQVTRWQRRRDVQETLERAATLQEMQQWDAAVTLLEQAVESRADSQELTDALLFAREGLFHQKREVKLARRVELIRRNIETKSWPAALSLLESTRKNFPNAPELQPLLNEVRSGLRRSECDSIITEVRQHLADGEIDQAEEALKSGWDILGPDPALSDLRGQLQSEKKYRELLRIAQVLFGRRQFREAEEVLTPFANAERPEALALLQAIRGSRAASEEEDFFERGREKALELMRQRQFAQASDLLRNLLAVFPGNAILQRDLRAAQNSVQQQPPEPAPVAEEADIAPAPAEPDPIPPPSAPQPVAPAVADAKLFTYQGATARSRRLHPEIVGGVILGFALAAGPIWKFTHPVPDHPASQKVANSRATAVAPPHQDSAGVAAPAAAPPSSGATAAHSTPPEVISKTPARYPEVARSRAVFGTVKVQAMVNERGDVTAVKFVSGSPLLAAAAKDAVMHWKFRPAQLNGHPAPGSAAVEVAFGDPNQ